MFVWTGGIWNCFENGNKSNAKAIAFFLCNQPSWNTKPLNEDAIKKWNESLKVGRKWLYQHNTIRNFLDVTNFGFLTKHKFCFEIKWLVFFLHFFLKDFPPHLILPHGSYLMNLGSPKPEILEKSRLRFVDELQRCEKLGIPHFNFHPGMDNFFFLLLLKMWE